MSRNSNASDTPSINSVIENLCTTRANYQTIKYTWKINNFRSFHDLIDSIGQSLLSPKIYKSESDNYIWWMLLDFHQEHLGIFLRLQMSDKKSTFKSPITNFKIALVNAQGEEKVKMETSQKFDEMVKYGWDNFVKKEYLYQERNNLLPNDELTIKCKIRYAMENDFVHKTVKIPESILHVNGIFNDLEALFKSEEHSDITVQVNDKKFKIHKAILSSRSPVFAAMLKNDMKESISNVINISDTKPEVFEKFLWYIYAEKVHDLDNFAEDLLALADKYAVESLKVKCENFLLEKINTENVSKMLVLADLHSAARLKQKAIHMDTNLTPEVIKTKEWTAVSVYSDLQTEICTTSTDNTEQIYQPCWVNKKRRDWNRCFAEAIYICAILFLAIIAFVRNPDGKLCFPRTDAGRQ